MSWFNLKSNVDRAKENTSEFVSKVKYQEIVTKSVDSFKGIISCDLLEGIQYRIVTNNSFNAISVLDYIKNKHKILEFYIAVYRMNLKSVNYLKDFISTDEVYGEILLSSFFRENKNYERWCNELIIFAEKSDKVKVSFSWNHAKVFIAKTECGKHIVFEGSGNLSDNARIEQYLIENNERVYNFHKKWITTI